jgi:hypothetical protein
MTEIVSNSQLQEGSKKDKKEQEWQKDNTFCHSCSFLSFLLP